MKNNILWLTGQPGSGKTTLSNEIKKVIENDHKEKKINVMQIDGDNLRDLTDNKDYSKEGRYANIRLAQKIALFLQNKNFLVIVSLVSPYLDIREELKKATGVFEVYLHTSETRGREHFFSADYEKPIDNYITVDTTNKDIKETANEILSFYW